MNPIETFPSPDGRFLLEIHTIEMRMSHEVECPYLRDIQTDKSIFSTGSLWDASKVLWSEDSQKLNMVMRHYTNGMLKFDLFLDLKNNTAVLLFEEREIYAGSIKSVASSMKKISNVDRLLKT